MFMAGEWKTMSNKTNERQLAHEFTWEGLQPRHFL